MLSEGAAPLKVEPSVKMIMPPIKIGLRPIISASRPAVSSTPAITTRYPMIIHSTAPLSGTPKARAIDGRLMFTIELSSVVIKAPGAASAKTAHLLARSWNGSGAGGTLGVCTTCAPSEAQVTPPFVGFVMVGTGAPGSLSWGECCCTACLAGSRPGACYLLITNCSEQRFQALDGDIAARKNSCHSFAPDASDVLIEQCSQDNGPGAFDDQVLLPDVPGHRLGDFLLLHQYDLIDIPPGNLIHWGARLDIACQPIGQRLQHWHGDEMPGLESRVHLGRSR